MQRAYNWSIWVFSAMKILTRTALLIAAIGCIVIFITNVSRNARAAAASELPSNFLADDKLAKAVLGNGLIELTERVMVLEKQAGIDPKKEQTR